MLNLEEAVAQKAQERERRLAQGDTKMIQRPMATDDERNASSFNKASSSSSSATNAMALQVSQKAQEREARLASGGEQRMTALAPEPEQKEDAKNVFLEAAQLGRLTRLNEHIVEAVAVEKTPHEEWRSQGLLAHVHIQRQHLLVIREAARAGALQKLPENVVANYNHKVPKHNLRQLEQDREHARIMNTVGTAHLKMDQVIQAHKKTHQTNQLMNEEDEEDGNAHGMLAAHTQNDTIVHSRMYYESFDLSHVQLPKDHLPKIDPQQNLVKIQQDLQKRKWRKSNSNITAPNNTNSNTNNSSSADRPMSNICSDVAKRANARRNRLNWPGSKPRVRQEGCQCPWCQKASPFQTHAYKQKEFIEKALERQRLENERLAELKKQRDLMLQEEEAALRKLYSGRDNDHANPVDDDNDEWEDAENVEPRPKAPPRTASRRNKRGGRRGSILAIFSSQNFGRNQNANDGDDNSSVQSDGTEQGLGAELRRAARKQKPRVVNRRGSLMGFAGWNKKSAKKTASHQQSADNTTKDQPSAQAQAQASESKSNDDLPSVASSQNPSDTSQRSFGAQIRSTTQKRKPRRGSFLGLVGGWGKKDTNEVSAKIDDNDKGATGLSQDDDQGTGLGAEIKRAARQRQPQQVSRRGSLLGMFGRGKQQKQSMSTDEDADDMLAMLKKKEAADNSKSSRSNTENDNYEDGDMLAALQKKQASERTKAANKNEDDDGGMLAVLQKKQVVILASDDEMESDDGGMLAALKKSDKQKRSKKKKKKLESRKEMLDYMKEAQKTNNSMLAHLSNSDEKGAEQVNDGKDSMMAHLNRAFQQDIGVSKSSDTMDYNAETEDGKEVDYVYNEEPSQRENYVKLDVSQDYGYEIDEIQDYGYEPQGLEDYGYGDAVPDNAKIKSEVDEERKANQLEKEAKVGDETNKNFYDQKNLVFENGIFYGFKMPDYSKEKPSEPSPGNGDEDGWETEAEVRVEENLKKKKKKGWFKRKKSKNKSKASSKEEAVESPTTKPRAGNRRGSILAVFGMASADKKVEAKKTKDHKKSKNGGSSERKSKSSSSSKTQKTSKTKTTPSPRKTTEIVPASQWDQQNRRGSLTVSYGWSRTDEDGDKTDFFFAPSITAASSDPSSRSPIRTSGTSKIRAAALKMQQQKSQRLLREAEDQKPVSSDEDVEDGGPDQALCDEKSAKDNDDTKGGQSVAKNRKATKSAASKKSDKKKKHFSNLDLATDESKVALDVIDADTAAISLDVNDIGTGKATNEIDKSGKPPRATSKGKSHRRSKNTGDDDTVQSSSTTNTLRSTRRGGKIIKKNKSSGDIDEGCEADGKVENISNSSRSNLRRSKDDPETRTSKEKKKHKSSKRKKAKSLKHSTHSAESRVSTDLSSDDFSLGLSGHSMDISLGETMARELDVSEDNDESEELEKSGNGEGSEKDFAEDEGIILVEKDDIQKKTENMVDQTTPGSVDVDLDHDPSSAEKVDEQVPAESSTPFEATITEGTNSETVQNEFEVSISADQESREDNVKSIDMKGENAPVPSNESISGAESNPQTHIHEADGQGGSTAREGNEVTETPSDSGSIKSIPETWEDATSSAPADSRPPSSSGEEGLGESSNGTESSTETADNTVVEDSSKSNDKRVPAINSQSDEEMTTTIVDGATPEMGAGEVVEA